MAGIFKFEVVELPKIYLVGKKIQFNSEKYIKGDNRIPEFWDKCLADGTFEALERQAEYIYEPGYAGACVDWDMGYGNFSYICGMLFREGFTLPEGYVSHEIGGEKVGVCWIKGKGRDDVCINAHAITEKAIWDAGLCPNQMKWSMQLSSYPRFVVPDEKGEIILDYYIPLSQSFDSLGKRIINAYSVTYPPFRPVNACSASEESQKQMYDFLCQSINIIYSDLSIIGIEETQDGCFEYWQLNNAKPELDKKMLKIKKNIYAFYEYLIKLGLAGEANCDSLFVSTEKMKLSSKAIARLLSFGFAVEESKEGCLIRHNKYKEMFPAWKLHSFLSNDGKITGNEITAFLNGCFGGKHYTEAEIFGRLCDPVLLSKLEQYFEEKGYVCKNNELRVYYEKEYPDKQKACMSIHYDWRKTHPLIIGFKPPFFSKVMKFYEQMDDELKALVFNRTKTCDGCGYCIQTDKTGKRPRLAIPLELDGEKRTKCPIFPSFNWGDVNEAMIHKVKKLLDFSESKLYG